MLVNKTQATFLPQAALKEKSTSVTFSKESLKRIAKKGLPYAMVVPSLSIFTIFSVYPIFYMVYLSFFKWNLIGPKIFIGLDNFTSMITNLEFWKVLGNSFKYMGFNMVFTIALALLLAVYLKKDTIINKFLQSAVFTPYIISLVSVSFIWMWLMDSDYGLLNYIVGLFGIDPIGWLDDPKVAMYSLIGVSVWKGLGYTTIVLVSAMHAIPKYLYEAASLDKASGIKVFFKITLPMLSPTLFFLALMNIIASFKVFETVSIMTGGGPMSSTNTIVFSIYEYGFRFYKIGYASALGVVLMIIIGICTIFYFKALEKRVHYR